MAPVYKLTYFNYMGVAEPIRYMLTYGGVNFENVMINPKTQWPALKQTVPFSRLPVLEVDDKVLYQSMAIVRFLAKKLNLLAADDWTNAQIDAIGETIYDLDRKVTQWHREMDSTRKNLIRKELETEYCPTYLTRMDKIVESNSGYFAGKLTWVDFWFVGIIESIECMWGAPVLETKYPHLFQLKQKILALPAIKAYVTKRPVTEW